MQLEGKTALITGAASGIGRAAAVAFSEAGASVAVNDVASLSETAGVLEGAPFSEHVADVSSSASVDSMVGDVMERWGKLDIVVANAGINRDGFVGQLSDEAWSDVLAVNLSGPFYVARAAFPHVSDGASILMTSSVSILGNVGQTNYAASKAGLVGLARSLALEGAKRGIRVNALAPGFIDTAMVASIPEKVRAKLFERVPLKRMGRPEEIAQAMLFLASDAASYITGQTLFVDGGLSVGL